MLLRLCLAFFILVVSLSTHAKIYKWTDNKGKTHFSDRKAAGVQHKVIALANATPDWSRFEISVKTINLELTAQEHQHIVDGANSIYEFYARVLYFDIYKTIPINILIFKDKKEYVGYLKQKNPATSTSSYGRYYSKENQIVVYIRADRAGTFRTIRHEISHAIINKIMPYIPAWLNEGLAEQMETLHRTDAGLYIESHTTNRTSVDRAVGNHNLTNISEFLKLPSDQWQHSLKSGTKS